MAVISFLITVSIFFLSIAPISVGLKQKLCNVYKAVILFFFSYFYD